MNLTTHLDEMRKNQRVWEQKPLLREIYRELHLKIEAQINPGLSGRMVEIGSGIGSIAETLPGIIRSDLFLNPWLDVVCDGYRLPFADSSISHLILFDVFHHLEKPGVFLTEARRVLGGQGRVIILDPYISWASWPVYGLLHHEPVGWRQPIDPSATAPIPNSYYAAQGNATRLLFNEEIPQLLSGWGVVTKSAFASFGYFLSGGFSKPALYPQIFVKPLRKLDRLLSGVPRLAGGRCLVVLEKR